MMTDPFISNTGLSGPASPEKIIYDRFMACLKQNGAKLTRPRKLVAHILSAAHGPLSAYDIRDAVLAQGDQIDVVSVYRIISILEQYALVTRVPSTNQVFRTTVTDDCHQHPVFICNTCGTAQELPWHGSARLMQDVAKGSNIKVEALSLELRGQCGSCTSAGSDGPVMAV
jgi:Fur family transcriptional regulator, zinc uptake regulator